MDAQFVENSDEKCEFCKKKAMWKIPLFKRKGNRKFTTGKWIYTCTKIACVEKGFNHADG